MKKLILIALLTTVGNYGNAQIGTLKGLKSKADKAKSKAGKSTKSGSTVDSKEILKTRELEGDAQEQIDLLNSYFSKDNIKNISTETIKETVYQLQSKLSTIKNYYAETSTKLSSIEAEYAKYKELSNKEYKDRDIASDTSFDLKSLSETADSFRDESKSSTLKVKYAEYKEVKDSYDAQTIKDDVTTGCVENLEDYFDNYIPNVYSKELKEYYLRQDYFVDESWMNYPKTAISKIDNVLENDIEEYKLISKQTGWIDEIAQMMKEQKLKLIDYKDNGDFAAFKEKKRREKADKVLPSKSVSSDPAVISVVRKGHNVERSGAIQKIIIVSDWRVEKNNLGIPLKKYIAVEVISKLDGECYLNSGVVFRTYEGGGTYGKKKLSFYSTSKLMNCSNY